MARLSRWEETIADGRKWRWHGLVWRTYILDDLDYWTIHPVINRKPWSARTRIEGWVRRPRSRALDRARGSR